MGNPDRASQTKLRSAEAYEHAIESSQTRRLQEIAGRLQLSFDYAFEFEVSDELPEMQAYAVHDLNLVKLDCELVNSLSDDALAWVIAHEVAHLKLDHGKKGIESNREHMRNFRKSLKELSDKAQRGDGSFWYHGCARLGLVANLGLGIFADERKREKEADALATEIIVKAGFDPDGAIEVLETVTGPLERSYKLSRHIANVFNTHPLPEVRATRIKLDLIVSDSLEES